MTWRVNNFERLLAELNLIALFDTQVDVRRIRGPVHDNFNATALTQNFARRIVIGMGVGVDGVEEFWPQKFGYSNVIVGFVDFRIDNNTDFFLGATKNVGQTTGGPDLLEKDFLTAHRGADLDFL